MLKHLQYSLPSAAHEASLEAEQFARRKMVLTVLMLFAAAFSAAQLPTTYSVLGATNAALGIWAIRAMVIVATLFLVMRATRAEAPRSLRRIAAAWSVGLVASVVLENRLLPPSHTAFVTWDVFFVFTLYSVVPLSIRWRAGLATILTLSDLAIISSSLLPHEVSQAINVALAYACANAVGVFVAWEIGRWRRQRSLAWENELAARRELENALAEIRTLRGIIPICSFCKNVRTDADGWHEIEDYVSCHSHAEFSHGVCPGCMAQHYPNVIVRENR